MSISLSVENSRIYFVGDTFAIKTKIKEIGGHWDGDRKQWWIGKVKLYDAEKLVKSPAEKEENKDIKLVGKAKYKGRYYYAAWVGWTKKQEYMIHLYSLDGKVDFWAKCALPHETQFDGSSDIAIIVKTYQIREYRGHKQYTTLESIRRFLERQKNPDTAIGECTECGSHGPLGDQCKDCYEGHFV